MKWHLSDIRPTRREEQSFDFRLRSVVEHKELIKAEQPQVSAVDNLDWQDLRHSAGLSQRSFQ